MENFLHTFEQHGFPTALAVVLLWLTWTNYNRLNKRVTNLERMNLTLTTDYSTSFRVTMERNNTLLIDLTTALQQLQRAVASCPLHIPQPTTHPPQPDNPFPN